MQHRHLMKSERENWVQERDCPWETLYKKKKWRQSITSVLKRGETQMSEREISGKMWKWWRPSSHLRDKDALALTGESSEHCSLLSQKHIASTQLTLQTHFGCHQRRIYQPFLFVESLKSHHHDNITRCQALLSSCKHQRSRMKGVFFNSTWHWVHEAEPRQQILQADQGTHCSGRM